MLRSAETEFVWPGSTQRRVDWVFSLPGPEDLVVQPRRVPLAQMDLLAALHSAQRGLDLGLIDRVVANDALEPAEQELAVLPLFEDQQGLRQLEFMLGRRARWPSVSGSAFHGLSPGMRSGRRHLGSGGRQNLTEDAPDRVLKRLGVAFDRLPQRTIDRTLVVSSAGRMNLLAEPFQHVVIDSNRDSSLPRRHGIHRPLLRSAEIKVLLHCVVSYWRRSERVALRAEMSRTT